VHGVDVEGMRLGILPELVQMLGEWYASRFSFSISHSSNTAVRSPIPVTYAGGVRSIEDLELVRRHGNNRVDVTVGSALDIFGGTLPYQQVLEWHRSVSRM
jgi:phosphoribosylformimino-5-aminoimidazole carboxamide ribotide isomerase